MIKNKQINELSSKASPKDSVSVPEICLFNFCLFDHEFSQQPAADEPP